MNDLEKRKQTSKELFALGKKKLESSKTCAENMECRDCVELAYYAVLYGIKALFSIDFEALGSQSQLFELFEEIYVKSGIFDSEAWKRIEEIRCLRDGYGCGEYSEAVDVNKMVETAEYILLLCNMNLNKKGVEV